MIAGLATGAAVGALNGILVTFVRIPSFLVTLGMIAWAAVVVGCNDKKGEFDGVGKWRFGHSTVSFSFSWRSL